MITKLQIDGQVVELEAQQLKGEIWFHWDGRTHCVSVDAAGSSKKTSLRGQGKVLAPMPGKITKVLVNEGQRLVVGAPVIVMEAMKMEYTLKAEVSGLLKSLHTKIGAQVQLGTCLAEIEPAKDTK